MTNSEHNLSLAMTPATMTTSSIALPQFAAHPTCTECGLYADCQSVGIATICYHEGEHGGPAIVFIGQNPGRQEDEANEPFVGRSGQRLKDGYAGPLLADHPDRTIYLTNAVRCHTTGNKKPPASSEKCFGLHTLPDLMDIMAKHCQVAIVLTGATAVSAAAKSGLIGKMSLTTAMRSQPLVLSDGLLQGNVCKTAVFAVFHPAAVLRDTSLAAPVGDHLNLIDMWLRDDMPDPLKADRVDPRPPCTEDPRTAALDIESPGAVQTHAPQTTFIAPLALARDGYVPSDLVQTLALTLYTEEEIPCRSTHSDTLQHSPKSPSKKLPSSISPMGIKVYPAPSSSRGTSLASPSSTETGKTRTKMTPTVTMVFNLQNQAHRTLLLRWINHLHSILGMNLLFDLTWCRASNILLRRLLDGRHTLRDVSVLNVLDNEARPERGLDDIGQIVGAGIVPKPLRGGFRFREAADPELHEYNAGDSHATVVIADALERRISERTPPSSYSEQFYSDLLWSTIHMQESGVPFSRRSLREVAERARIRTERCRKASSVPLAGKGSATSARVVLQQAYDLVRERGIDIEDHPCFKRTPETNQISTSKLSRRLFIELLRGLGGSSGSLSKQLRLMQRHQEARDLISRFTVKLLKLGIPRGRDSLIVFPSWHMTPSPFKDKQGAEGGTRNSRFAASNPPIQQIGVANVKHCIRSRHYRGSIVWVDLSQIELRVLALESGDPYLLRAFRDGVDMHTALALSVCGSAVVQNPWFKSGHSTKDPRQTYKKANFLTVFGGGARMLIQSILRDGGPLLSLSAARQIIDTIRSQRSVAFAWQAALVQRVMKTGCLELPFTRQCRHFSTALKHGRPVDERNILNFPTQAEASNVTCRMMEVWRVLPKGVRMFLNMHDALAFDCPPGTGPATISAIKDVARWVEHEDIWAMMQNHYGNDVPLRYDIYEVKK